MIKVSIVEVVHTLINLMDSEQLSLIDSLTTMVPKRTGVAINKQGIVDFFKYLPTSNFGIFCLMKYKSAIDNAIIRKKSTIKGITGVTPDLNKK